MEALGATILVGLGALGRLTAQWTLTEAIIPPNKVALDEHGRQVVGFRKTKRTNDFSRKRLQPQTTSAANDFSRKRLPPQLRFLGPANTNLAEH